MYRLKSVRSRKDIAECTPDHRARINRLMKRARLDSDWSSLCFDDSPHSASDVSHELWVEESRSEFIGGENSDVQRTVDEADCCAFVVSNVRDSLLVFPRDVDSESDVSSAGSLNMEAFEAGLATVFTDNNFNHQQIRAILRFLKTHRCFSQLHVDPRTILHTLPHSAPIKRVAGGEYLHLGVKNGINNILASSPPHLLPVDSLELDFSTDEASLDKNSKIRMWPIQIRVANIPDSKPEVVEVFKGSSKPSSWFAFFESFVEELNAILRDGILFQNERKRVNLRCFIADAPARAFSLGHRGHNSRAPCSRCWVRGEHIRAGVMIYKGTDHRLRTQEEYSSMVDSDHHNGA